MSTTYTESEMTTNVAIAELGAAMKSLSQTVVDGFKRIEDTMAKRDADVKDTMAKRDVRDDLKHAELELRLTAVERVIPTLATHKQCDETDKRVDKVYWVWGAAVFVGSPLMVIITKLVMSHFGL